MTDSAKSETSTSSRSETRREKLTFFILFLGFSILEVAVLAFSHPTFEKWGDWMIAGGALLFPILTVLSWKSLISNWSVEESDHAVGKVFGWIIAAPVIVAALVLVGWALFSFLGWLATIPVWAAVIIILLLLRR